MKMASSERDVATTATRLESPQPRVAEPHPGSASGISAHPEGCKRGEPLVHAVAFPFGVRAGFCR